MRWPIPVVALALLGLYCLARAEQPQTAPTAELLEFLGEWETDEARWQDPEMFEELELLERAGEDESMVRQ